MGIASVALIRINVEDLKDYRGIPSHLFRYSILAGHECTYSRGRPLGGSSHPKRVNVRHLPEYKIH